jgi:phosphohistidine phosphatase SixA
MRLTHPTPLIARVVAPLWALLLLAAGSSPASSAPEGTDQQAAEADLWTALRNGEAAVLMRHALAPGTGDPGHFDVNDCATQRNLSDTGRAQAAAIGERFRQKGIAAARVYSSRWCRCLETARLLDLGAIEPFDALNSFFRDRAAEPERTAAALSLLQAGVRRGEPPLVLVTHQVNITALTDVFPGSGSMLLVRPGGDGVKVLGRVDTR